MVRSLRLCALVALASSVGGCELDESCDPATDPNCLVAGGGTTAPATTWLPYVYVMVLDRSEEEDGQTGGADIFGIQLEDDGNMVYADVLHECQFGSLDNSAATNCTTALAAPIDGQGICQVDPEPGKTDYVSLGGTGGMLVVSFGTVAIEAGNSLIIHECGRDQTQTPGAVEDHYDVRVGVSLDPADPNWIPCLIDATGVRSCKVPTLPQVPAN